MAHHHRSSMLPWKTVDVSLPEPTKDHNHYDHDDIHMDELEAIPGEHVAMFYGLQVLEGHEYTVNKNGELSASSAVNQSSSSSGVVVDDNNNNNNKTTNRQQNEGSNNNTNEIQKKKGKKRKASSRKDMASSSGDDTAAATLQPMEAAGDCQESESTAMRKKKRKESTKKCRDEPQPPLDSDGVLERMQTNWMVATGGVTLDARICASLIQQNFCMPTPIQSATLPASIMGRRNIVGAAPTGSGKTLAYLIPIVQYLYEEEARRDCPMSLNHCLVALIVTPTRELALQVSRECDKLLMMMIPKQQCGVIVGGLALPKQERILTKQRPAVLVATPGRLWELMSSRQHTHLTNLSQLRFLVVDEADRMIQQGSFPQLTRIFDAIHDANPMEDSHDDDEADSHDDDEAEEEEIESNRLLALPGIPGEAKVTMLKDVLERMHQTPNGNDSSTVEPVDLDEDEFAELAEENQVDDDDEDDVSLPPPPPVFRQTFVFSATLTLPPSSSYVASKREEDTKNKKKRGKKSKKQVTVEGAIAEILEKARAKGPTKVVDLTTRDQKHSVLAPAGNSGSAVIASSPRLPPGLSLRKIECTQRHKDSHLYAYLVTTSQGASGPCLVFCNSIAAVRRVGATLEALLLPVRMLHANMTQKARFKAVESLREPKSRAIVVATDVAARGLDIPSVATVVHYDVARQVDTFVHRAGRTARGMGQSAVGCSLSLIAPGEDKAHDKVCEALQLKHMFEIVQMDGRLLAVAQERANLAAKIVECDEVEQKANKSNRWFQDAAEQAGLELDDDMLDEGLAGGDPRDQLKLREAKAARGRLRQLLAQPMQAQRFGKFLSSNSAATDPEVAAYVVPLTTTSRNKKKRKRARKE